MKSWKKVFSAVLASSMVLSGVTVPSEVHAASVLASEENEVVRTENVNHVRTATLTASTKEVDSLGAEKAGDGNESTRWASDYETPSGMWLKATFEKDTLIKHIKVKLFTRNVAPTPSNVAQFSVKYTDAEGNEKYAKQNYKNTASGSGFATEVSIILDEAIVAKDIQLCEFVANASQYNNVGVVEFEAYSNAQEEPVQPVDPIDEVTVTEPKAGDTKLVVNLPQSEDYTITYNGTDYEQVVDENLNIYTPLVDTTVNVSFKSVNKTDDSDYSFKEIEVTIPGTYQQAEDDNAAPAVIPELTEWKGYKGNFTVSKETKIVIASEELRKTAEAFADDYKDLSGNTMAIVVGKQSDAKAGDFYFELTDDTALGLMEEGYLMEIKDQINVKAETSTGAFWATRTLLQALKSNDMQNIPQGITRDYPLYKVRGVILDVGRKTFTLDYLKQMVKQMSWYKLNDFHIHLNDNYIFLEDYTNSGKDPMTAYSGFRLESDIKKGGKVTLNGKEFTYQADLTSKDVFYTKDEFRSFIAEAGAYGVNIVPEFDAPAHSLAFAKVLPELRTGTSGRMNDHLDLANQYNECYDFITNIFDEYLTGENPVFSEASVVHVGCDEYTVAPNAFRQFCNDMADYVESTGRTARIWGSLTAFKGDGSVPVDGTGIQMNLWNFGYANMDEMYESGFDLINCNDGTYYIVPNAGYYGDYLSAETMYNSAVNSIGGVTIPAGDDQMLGASYAVWNDMIDLKDNGISEYDIYKRLTNNMALFGAKLWGKGDMTMTQAQKAGNLMGDAPNTDFNYETETDKYGNIADFSAEDLAAMDKKNADISTVDEVSALKLSGGESYAVTGMETLGLGTELTVKVMRTGESTADQILFESPYGSIKAVQGKTGNVGISRENFDYSFDYELPVGEWVTLTFKNEFETVALYVDGKLTDTLGDGEIILDRPMVATCMFPLAKIGSATNAFEGYVASVSAKTEPVREYYKGAVTVTASSEETQSENGAAANVTDGDTSTIWHTNYSGAAATPHWIQLALAEETQIDAVVYQPRTSGTNGNITKYVIKVSNDGKEFQKVAEGSWASSSSVKKAEFDAVAAKYVRIEVVESVGNFASAAEIQLRLPMTDEQPSTPEEKDPVTEVFTDVVAGSWYVDAVQYVYNTGLMSGFQDQFTPNANMSRAMVVTTLYRMEGSPAVTDYSAYLAFKDVKVGDWYADAVAWALNNDIATGDPINQKFNPNANVTREQLAAFLYRYTEFKGGSVTERGDFSDMKNADKVSSWALKEMQWAVGTELISGIVEVKGEQIVARDLAPQGNATRAQMATILQRYCEK